MKIKEISFFILTFIILSIRCQIKIFPDHISSGDPIFNTSQVYDKTNERFYYELGYYTEKDTPIYSKKYGIFYSPVKCNSGVPLNYDDNDQATFIGKDKIIGDSQTTIDKEKNFFEELELFKNVMKGRNIECNSNLKVIHDINLRITYIIPVVPSGNKFTLDVKKSDDNYIRICDVNVNDEKLKIIRIDIKTEIENNLDQDVKMIFKCTDAIENKNITLRGNMYLTFVFNKEATNDISLSNFRITVEDLFTKTGITYNKILDRSKLGLRTEDNCDDNDDCFRGHICDIHYCKRCHFSCIDCYQSEENANALSSCKKCGALTIDSDKDPVNGICPINFVDLSQFRDINVKIMPKGSEYNERATIGLWLFFSDLTNSRSLTNDIYHIILVDRFVISLVPGDNEITAYCHAYEDLYRRVTSDTTLHSSYTDRSSEYVISNVIPNDPQFGRLDIPTMNGKWFHISCGISFEHEEFYLKSVVNGQSEYQRKELKKEKLYPNSGLGEARILNDVYFNHIINEGEYLYLALKNFKNSNAKIYGRHLMFFKEYISYEMQYMYFDFKDVNDFKEILYQIPFDRLFIENSYKIIGYQYDGNSIVSSDIILELSHSETTDFRPPLNFYRLFLNTPNKKYKQIDLKSDTSNIIEEDLNKDGVGSFFRYLYDDNKILNCKYYDNIDLSFYYNSNENSESAKCSLSKCNENYITYPGVSKTTGYCDYRCLNSLQCKQMVNSNDYEYTSDVFCKTTNNFYNLFYKCVDPSHNYYLQYSGFYNSQLIEFNLPNPLSSYIMEFWFYPDFFLRAKARESQFNYPTYTKNFFFHSNVIDCYFSQTDRLVPYIYDSYKVIKINKLFNSNEWNNFVIFGKYYSLTEDYSKTVFVNHAFDQPFEFDISKQNKATILTTITFCENKCQDINGDNIHWTTGYYRDLKIWDGNMASFSQIIQYEHFYPLSKYSKRVKSILHYFPFSNQYIANNKIRDPQENYIFNINSNTEFRLKKYNYGENFDIIVDKAEEGYYSSHASDPAYIDSCDIGCKRCWDKSFCYECITNYFLSGRKCLLISKYYFRNPPHESNSDFELNYNSASSGITITFWTKPIGFEFEQQDMITLGSNPNLLLMYSGKEGDDPGYGLFLLGNKDSNSEKRETIGFEREFRDNIGKWTFISIAFHKQIKNDDELYFPRMIKFEINTNSIEAIPESITDDPNLDKIILDKGYFGLFVGIKYYNSYIIQAITFEKIVFPFPSFSLPLLVKAQFEKDSLALMCKDGRYTNDDADNDKKKDYECVPDEGPDVGSFLDTCLLYKDTSTPENSCLNYCSGSGWTRCNCLALNQNSQMIYKNNNKNLCRPLDYINFSKIKKIEVNDLGSAKVGKKCTMQFWMYAYPYEPRIFKGITFHWTRHNKIKLELNPNNNLYSFKCFATPGESENSGSLNQDEIELKQWVFLSCAVDYGEKILYLNSNTEKNKIILYNTNSITGDITEESSELYITDDTEEIYKDWGLLFFRQVRLWKDAYFNAGFLSRILIETPSKFPTLMNSWEPIFNGIVGDNNYGERNFHVKDLVNNKMLSISYQWDFQSLYGMNVIDENYYSILTMCSEDGLYYDVTLGKCLQFLDLSKMKDFTFKELPSAYSGSYAMAFWIFFEDSNKYRSKGLRLKWSRHLQIIIKKNSDDKLYGYCFPQGYYSDYELNDDESDIDGIYEKTLNKAKIILVEDNEPEDGVWIWVICSVSYYGKYFFLQGNRNQIANDSIYPEILRGEGDDRVNTSYPMRFYLSDLNNKVMYKSSLSIININDDVGNNDKKLYLREILLFRNYIPKWYSDRFKYMNMKMLTDNQLPDLLFVANFADFNLETKNLKYIYFERKVGSNTYERVDTSIYLTVKDVGITFELSANFDFQPLCDLSTTEFKKYENGRCVDIQDCKLREISAAYCMDEKTPLTCESGKILTLNSAGEIICNIQCVNVDIDEQNKFNFITPGTPRNRGICNTLCPTPTLSSDTNLCPYTLNLMKCIPINDYYQIGYKCIEEDNNDISALFFSKCYNSPNFYRTISTTTLEKISSGYFYEFWIKIDTKLIGEFTCKEAGKESKEYYLYSTPHSIYYDREEGKYYYQIINSAYKSKMDGIVDEYWNKIVIETKISTTGQDVHIHTNFEKGNSIISILSVSLSIPMRLQYISFCSRKASGDCIPGSSNIMWGSAYYRNIRVWDIRSSSIYTIQDYNNGIFSDLPTSLILFYPLTIKYMDKNIIKETISGIDNLNVTHQFSNNFQSEDNVINYNYETNLEWDFKHQCIQKEEDIVETTDRLILVKEDCINITGYYLKVNASSSIAFNISKIDELEYEAYTFCIYIKFIGVLQESTSSQPIIFSFKDDTFIVYDIATSYIIFYIGGSDKEAFRDTNFHAYIGVWTPICIANLRSKDTYIHPHMITLNVNKIDIPFSSGFSIVKDGIHFERISLGTEIIAYFADFRIYSRFIQGNFGTIISKVRDEENILLIYYPLTCKDNHVIANFSDSSMDPPCVKDHNIYLNETLTEKDDTQYFDTELKEYFGSCDENCKTLCYNSKNSECTCDMTETVYWLRRNKATGKTYCEHPPYIDYSILKDIYIKVPSSSTNESTIEFWFYIYSYNTTNINFKEINIIWDKHNRVHIINERNSLSAKCYALWDTSNENIYTEQVQTISVTAFGWTSIRCGSDINLPTYKHFFNTYEKTVSFGTLKVPYDRNKNPTTLIIRNINTSPPSYGFFFIRELKLWQQYNVNYIDTSYMNLDLVSIGFYNPITNKTEGKYPGLITLIRSEYKIEDFNDSISGHYHTENLVINEESPGDYNRTINLEKNEDNFIGYNLIDPTNSDYYKTLILCDEGWVYNSLFNYCEKPSYTKCLYPGDVKDNCIRCPDNQIYIHPVDGLCKEDCPIGYYHRDDMNQCRPCNETCYKCNWTFGFNCTECIGDRYLVENESQCVLKCEDFNLTASKVENNKCTEFYADAILINHKPPPEEYVDINTFDDLVAKVTEYTSRDYTVLWGFERELTIEKNNEFNKTIELPNRSPFIGDLTKEEKVLLDKTYFELAKYYVFSLTVTAHNILYYEATVSQKINFTLLMNSYPVNGSLTVFPEIGLYRTTYFVIRCVEFGDETTVKENLEYSFYSIEENTAVVNHLRGWSKENEISTNFSVIYYQQEQSKINIYCRIKDELNATYITEPTQIIIAKSLNGGIYNFSEALSYYSLPTEEEKNKFEYDVLLYHRSQYLLSLSIDVYKTVYPSFLQTQFESALDGTEVLMEDPTCVSEYCNGNGDCVLVDEFIICHCKEGWTGKYCHIDKRGLALIESYYFELFNEIMKSTETSISWYQFMGIYNLFKGASLFINNTEFFSVNLLIYFDNAMKTFPDSINNNTMEYLEMIDFYYSYEMMRMEKLKTDIQFENNDLSRNISFNDSQMKEFQEAFKTIDEDFLLTFMRHLANLNSIARRSFIFNSENYYLAIIPVNPSFDDKTFFEERKSKYRTYVDFMSCLNYIEMDKLANPYYQGYFLYIEYNYLLFGYNDSLIVNNSSPMIEMRFVDSTTGKYISITGCEDANQLIIHMPYTSYRYLEEFNYQKLLYDPHIYKSPDDPIFSDPVYIEDNGHVSDDTIEQRIEKYSRKYNITPTYYSELYEEFLVDGITYINFTNDINFIEYSSTHLCKFTCFMVENNATYHPNGRFYYLARPRILKYFPNFYQSYGSLIFLAFLVIYIILMIIFICYDRQFTTQEGLLEYIKREIVKNFFPYAKNKDEILEKLIPTQMNLNFKPINKFGPNARNTQKDKILQTLEPDKEDKLTLRHNRKIKNSLASEEDEEEKNAEKATTKRELEKKKARKNINNFMSEKPGIKKKTIDEKVKNNIFNEDDYESEIDREIGNINRATFTIKHLPKDFEKSKEEKERRIENYAHLKLTSRHYFNANYKLRTTIINSLGNVSLFQPRWKKLTMFITEIGLMILVISIILTIDENAKLSNGLIIMGYLCAYGLAASTFSNLMMYFIALFFHFPQELANRLYKYVLFNGQLIVLREWENITFDQGIKSIPGVILCVIFWLISLYVGLGFTAVWKDQNFEFLISFGFAFLINFFVMELIVEGFIAIIYIGRKKYNCLKRFGFMLNRLRNYRCLSP